jgi:hypothetical protein
MAAFVCDASPLAAALAPAAIAQEDAPNLAPSLAATGLGEYYCQVTLTLENRGAGALAKVNGHLVSEVDGERVGRSRGASFLDLAPGATAEAVFETPNVPCDAVTAYRLVVGARRDGHGFLDRADCAARIEPVAPIAEVVAR